jgi:hypothetical protein
MMQESHKYQFQGSRISRVPSYSGLYAWYYKPLVVDEEAIVKTLTSFIDISTKVLTEIEMRYGLKLTSKSILRAEFGSQKQSAYEVINQVASQSDNFLTDFFKSNFVQSFSRPIYIGIAKNLNTRVYNQHYSNIVEMYDITSPVNRYLSIHSNATVQEVMDNLELPHSFALEARVRNIAPRDLVVNIFTTDLLPNDIGIDSDDPQFDTPSRRALERLLQLVADPICGRR